MNPLARARRTYPRGLLSENASMTRPRIAAVVTEYRRYSHAQHILDRFLLGYGWDGRHHHPPMDLLALYVDQQPESDLSRARAELCPWMKIYPTIADALCQGGEKLAVDGVLLIGEHGRYPKNEKGQTLYPRYEFFQQIVEVFRTSGRSVPVFNDKHLSWNWDWAKEMVATSKQMGFAFLAGSSVPSTRRLPSIDMPFGAEVEEAMCIAPGGPDGYDIHALEVLQSMVENRKGDETGITAVEFLEGDALWKAAENGRWSPALAAAALSAEIDKPIRDLWQFVKSQHAPPHGILLTYKDGLKGTVLKIGDSATRWNFACRFRGDAKPQATHFYVGPWNNRCLFKALAHAIQSHFIHGKAPYPVERTLLTTGAVEAAVQSRAKPGKPLRTKYLEFAYHPRDFRRFREMGDSWKIITEQTPEPKGLDSARRYFPQ